MWNRTDLKSKAKNSLKGNYWPAFLVSFLILITGGSHNRGEFQSTSGSSGGGSALNYDFEIYLLFAIVILIIILLRLFIGYFLEVGGRKYFIELTKGTSNLSYLGYVFSEKSYINVFKTMFLRSIYLILWTLLLIIPGIIKFYAYRLVPYILADNPEIGSKRAIKLSQEMMRNEKLKVFVLDLSFIGWFIFGALLFGIGVFFVQPYYDATNGELYIKLREKALKNNLITSKELRLTN